MKHELKWLGYIGLILVVAMVALILGMITATFNFFTPSMASLTLYGDILYAAIFLLAFGFFLPSKAYSGSALIFGLLLSVIATIYFDFWWNYVIILGYISELVSVFYG